MKNYVCGNTTAVLSLARRQKSNATGAHHKERGATSLYFSFGFSTVASCPAHLHFRSVYAIHLKKLENADTQPLFSRLPLIR